MAIEHSIYIAIGLDIKLFRFALLANMRLDFAIVFYVGKHSCTNKCSKPCLYRTSSMNKSWLFIKICKIAYAQSSNLAIELERELYDYFKLENIGMLNIARPGGRPGWTEASIAKAQATLSINRSLGLHEESYENISKSLSAQINSLPEQDKLIRTALKQRPWESVNIAGYGEMHGTREQIASQLGLSVKQFRQLLAKGEKYGFIIKSCQLNKLFNINNKARYNRAKQLGVK